MTGKKVMKIEVYRVSQIALITFKEEPVGFEISNENLLAPLFRYRSH